ncbi:uncharacterized protein TNCV_443541 [Trichonephila clavipes]|nr:uncharacterized protein TNCV_443541 [Trichonephila clavipes]
MKASLHLFLRYLRLPPLTASPVSVKLSTYDGKTNWEKYKTQFSIISEANGWTEGVKAYENKTPENRRKLAGVCSEVERRTNLAFSDHPATVREVISSQYYVDSLKDGEIQRAVRMAYALDLKSALLYALKLEAANEASCRDRHSIRGARVTADAPCDSPWIKEIEKLREEVQELIAQRQNLRRRRIS